MSFANPAFGAGERLQTPNPIHGLRHMETETPESDDGQFTARATPSSACVVCGAKLRRKPGQFCKRFAVPGRRRCLYHGGRTPRGADSPHFKHGLYSRALPRTIRKDYEKLMRDPALLDGRAEVAILQIRLSQLTARVGTSESDAAWRELDQLLDKLTASNVAGDEFATLAVLDRMRELVKGKVDDATAWAELTRAIESATRVSEREWKRVLAAQNVVTAEQVRAVFASLTDAVLQYVTDPRTRQLIADRVNRLRIIGPVGVE